MRVAVTFDKTFEYRNAEKKLAVFNPKEISLFMDVSVKLFGVPYTVDLAFKGQLVDHFIQIWFVLSLLLTDTKMELTMFSAKDLSQLFASYMPKVEQWLVTLRRLDELGLIMVAHPCYFSEPFQMTSRVLPCPHQHGSDVHKWILACDYLFSHTLQRMSTLECYPLVYHEVIRSHLGMVHGHSQHRKEKYSKSLLNVAKNAPSPLPFENPPDSPIFKASNMTHSPAFFDAVNFFEQDKAFYLSQVLNDPLSILDDS